MSNDPGSIPSTFEIPEWVTTWIRGSSVGTSSETIAFSLLGVAGLLRRTGAPYDTSDVYRCVQLLDLAEAHGMDWRARLGEVAQICSAWKPLVPLWPQIEKALEEDIAAQNLAMQRAQTTKNGKLRLRPTKVFYPPSRTWWLVATARGHHDPYSHLEPHPFRTDVSREEQAP